MTARQERVTVPSAVGVNRERIRILEANFDPIALRPPQMMGGVDPSLTTTSGGKTVRSRGGLAYRSDADRPMVTGDELKIDYFGSVDGFDQLSFRAHLATGLTLNKYLPRQPWESQPWFGSKNVGSAFDLTPFGDWNGYFYTFLGVSNMPGDVIHFETVDGTINSDEAFGFDTPNGHIGYLFHNAIVSDTTAMTATYTTGTGQWGYTRMLRGTFTGTVVTTTLGTGDDTSSARQASINLSADVPEGDCVLVIVVSEDDEVEDIGDAANRPTVWDFSPLESQTGAVEEVPHYWWQGRWYPILVPSEARGTGDIA